MTALIVSLAGLATAALILVWSSWRFGATMPASLWLRCLLAFPILTACASLTEGWVHARFMPWWFGASLIGVREEGLKLLFFIVLAGSDPDARSSGDRLHAMTAVALGFAVIEAINHAMLRGAMPHVLPQAYVGFYAGTAIHVFLSLQALAFLSLARNGSRFWLVGIIIPMALHSIWDSTYLIGISSSNAAVIARVVIAMVTVGGTLVLTRLGGVQPDQSPFARRLAVAAMTLWLLTTTALQIAGKAKLHYGVTVIPYSQMVVGWWVVGIDLAMVCYWPRYLQSRNRLQA